jgi:hypothetical protein
MLVTSNLKVIFILFCCILLLFLGFLIFLLLILCVIGLYVEIMSRLIIYLIAIS